MRIKKLIFPALLLLVFPLTAGPGSMLEENFDTVKAGTLPGGWKIAETRGSGKTALWRVESEGEKFGGVLRVMPRKGTSGGTFNLCWTDSISFLDGEIKVSLRADSGSGDQGGGPMWRVRDADNYYVARYNPLENNFRLYKVSGGIRTMLKSASGIRIPTGKWFNIRIVQQGPHIQCFLDGKKYLETEDTTFSDAGGVGLWSKADAATSFDNVVVTAEQK